MTDDAGAFYSPTPEIGLVADTPEALGRGRAAARAVGADIAVETTLEACGAALENRIRLDALLVFLGDADEDAAGTVIAAAALRAGQASVVVAPLDRIDAVDARFGGEDVELLCDPSDTDLVAALGLALARRIPALHEPRDEGDDPRLLRISEEVGRIARALADLSQGEASPANGRSRLGEAPFAYRPAEAETMLDADRIRQVIRMRRLRDRFFDASLFADPAWDMLLDLMAARLERRDVAVSSLCIAAAVPPTTALRWIKTMTEAGLFVRHADPADGRRIFIALADEAASAMDAWFAAVRREGGTAAV